MGPNNVWESLGLGTEVSLKPLAPPWKIRRSSLVAGKREGVGSFEGRVGTSESKKLKFKVGDF